MLSTFKIFLSENLPPKIKSFLKEFSIISRRIIFHPFLIGKNFKCPFCKKSFSRFLSDPDGLNLKVFREKNIIGGGPRKNAICPFCSSNYLERFDYLFLNENKLLKKGMNLLHIAPERNLERAIKNSGVNYFPGDLNPQSSWQKINVQKINYQDSFFDGIICNHV